MILPQAPLVCPRGACTLLVLCSCEELAYTARGLDIGVQDIQHDLQGRSDESDVAVLTWSGQERES